MWSAVPHQFIAPPSSSDCLAIPGAPPLPVAGTHLDPSVPSFEPPTPISARFFSQSSRWKWWLERWWELPSWMTSLVLHLTVTIVFASLAIKAGSTPTTTMITLDATIAAEDDPWSSIDASPIVAAAVVEISESSHSDDTPGETLVNLAIDPNVPDFHVQRTAIEDAGSDQKTTPDNQIGSLLDAPSVAVAKIDATDLVRQLARGPDVDFPIEVPEEPTFDDIVEQFIQYDIGRLQGAAAERAQRNFSKLGPKALPALVRGLNRSASIQASCPVVVISRKLEVAVQQTNDRAMIDYVLQNIGRDVPDTAPHAPRLDSLRNKLVRAMSDRKFKRDLGRVEPLRGHVRGDWEARVKRLYDASADEVATALDDVQLVERAAAWSALSMQRRVDFTADERTRVVRVLLSQWTPHNEAYRRRIHGALTSLAQAAGAPERLPKYERRRSNKTGLLWQAWWKKHGGTNRESASAELVRLAEFADERASQRLLARVVEKFPETKNATLARHMLTPTTRFALAQTLEEQLRLQEAIKLYEEIEAGFGGSEEAAASKLRLEALDVFRPSSFAEFEEVSAP